MTGVVIDRESTTVHEPVYRSAKFPVDMELVVQCQKLGDKPYRGVQIGTMGVLYPHSELKAQALHFAKMFIMQMQREGLEAAEPETLMELWGPYRERVDWSSTNRMVNIEEGNPFFPDGRWVSDSRGATKALSRQPQRLSKKLYNDPHWKRGVIFLIRGRFVATKGREEEATGTLIV